MISAFIVLAIFSNVLFSAYECGSIFDHKRSEKNMSYLFLDEEPFEGYFSKSCRVFSAQIYSPQSISYDNLLPIIVFSPGMGENCRFYSTILSRLSECGYVIVNIDHYYGKDVLESSGQYCENMKKYQDILWKIFSKNVTANTMIEKSRTLDVFLGDLEYVLTNLKDILTSYGYEKCDFDLVTLMGHSLGGNACKKFVENYNVDNFNIKAQVALDSRMNQFCLRKNFAIPTLLIEAWWHSHDYDVCRYVKPQENVNLIVMKHSTHMSFSDLAIFHTLEMDFQDLFLPLNKLARIKLENVIERLQKENLLKINTPPFLGDKADMENFLNSLIKNIDVFLKNIFAKT